jgi:predicted DNA binding CopG/RHH family protein
MVNDQMTPEEQDILESVERGEWQSVPKVQQEIERYQSYARAQLGELQEIKIELPSQDIQFLQALANETETPLTLVITNLLHQFVLHNLEAKGDTHDASVNSSRSQAGDLSGFESGIGG